MYFAHSHTAKKAGSLITPHARSLVSYQFWMRMIPGPSADFQIDLGKP